MREVSIDKKRMISNFFSLSILQFLNLVLPLITVPYVVRVIGIEKFGLVNYALSIIMYFTILVNFGLDLSVTPKIAINRDNSKFVSELFSVVMTIKIVLILLSFVTLLIALHLVPSLKKNFLLFFLTFGFVIGNGMLPSWFYQGMEKMKYLTMVNSSSRIFFTVLMLIMLKSKEDFILVAMFNSLGAIVGGVLAFFLVFKLFNVTFIMPKLNRIKNEIKESFHFFLSRIAYNGSRYLGTTIIGSFFGNTLVGYYSIVEKLFYAFLSLGEVIFQTIYPYMSRTRNIVFFKKLLLVVILISISILFPLMYYNQILLDVLFDINNKVLSDLFVIVFVGAIFGIVHALLGYSLLGAFGYRKEANNSLIYSSTIYIISVFIGAFIFKDIYIVAFSIVIYHLSAFIFRTYYTIKYKLL